MRVPPVTPTACGNGVLDEGESCDGVVAGGVRCVDLGPYSGGTVTCTGACQLDTGGCVAGWGASCTDGSDCPGTGSVFQTICDYTTGGYCMQMNGPDFVAEGQPCAGDPESVGVIGSDGVRYCLRGCAAAADCRPGYTCVAGLGTTRDLQACLAITDCDTRGCNDAGAADVYWCDSLGRPDRHCWLDACVGDPCAADVSSDHVCSREEDTFRCGCVAGTTWDALARRCEALACSAVDLGARQAGDPALVRSTGSTCGQSGLYDPTGSGCTGWAARGPEQLHRLRLAAGTGATISADPTDNFDLSLYVMTACDDPAASSCIAGSDLRNPETVHIANDSASPADYFLVVDGAYEPSCGAFVFSVEPFAFTCAADDLGTFTGAAITRTAQSNCAGASRYNPGANGCTGNHATGNEQLYSLTVPAGQTVRVNADGDGSLSIELYVLTRCGDYGGATCVAGGDAPTLGGVASLTFSNASALAATYFIVVDSFNAVVQCGTFALTVEPV